MANSAKIRFNPEQVSELVALLNEIAAGESCDPILQVADSQQLAENQPRIVETQRLIEVRRQQIVPGNCLAQSAGPLSRYNSSNPRTIAACELASSPSVSKIGRASCRERV